MRANLTARPGRLLVRCLEKDPKRRLRDIADARDDLATAGRDDRLDVPTAGAGASSSAARLVWLPWGMAAAGLAVAAWLGLRSASSPSTPAPEFDVARVTFDSGVSTTPALSRDGRLLVYASTRSGRGDLDVWLQQSSSGLPLRLTDDPAVPRAGPVSDTAGYVRCRYTFAS